MNKEKKDACFSAFYHKQTARIGRSLKGRRMCSRGWSKDDVKHKAFWKMGVWRVIIEKRDLTPSSSCTFALHMPLYTIRYRLVIKLGPMNKPIQKIKFPNVSLPFINFVLDIAASGTWLNCSAKRYPLTFLNRQNMSNSCTTALNKNVANVAPILLKWNADIEEW